MKISKTKMAIVFDKWNAEYAADPNAFSDLLDADGNPIEGYGAAATAIFMRIFEEFPSTE